MPKKTNSARLKLKKTFENVNSSDLENVLVDLVVTKIYRFIFLIKYLLRPTKSLKIAIMSSFFPFIQHTAPQHVLMNQLKQNIIEFNQFAEKKRSIHKKKTSGAMY